MIRQLSKSLREYKKETFITPAFIVGEVFLECLIPMMIAKLVNQFQTGCDLEVIWKQGVLLVIMACFSLFFGGIAGSTASTAACGLAKNLRKDVFYKVQDFSFENIDRFSTSSLVTRLTTDITNVQMAFMMIIRTAVRAPLMFIVAVVMAFVMGGSLAGIFAVVVPILIFVLLLVIKRTMPLFQAVFKKYDTVNNSIQENIKGMRVVKSFVREDYEKKKFEDAAEDVCKDFTKAERILACNMPTMQFCLYAVMLFVMYYGAYVVISNRGMKVNVGQLSSLLTYSFQILSSLMMLSMIFVMVTMSVESAKRIAEVLSDESAISNPENPVTEVKDGSIDFEGVNFKYSKKADKNALSDIDLHIKSGETIGIIGGTGSSKSSLVQLICRLYDVTEGTVKVGGTDVREYDLQTLRNQVAVVLQKNVLFSGTIKDNLRWGNKDATDEEMVEVCKIAQADEFIQTFPDKYDTYIEQGGANVSGGQKQRLCIARALLKDTKILIFDDSTSAVDTKTDALLRKSLAECRPDTTKIMIAQRISSVQDADRIIVMDGGTINGIGTHEQLLETNEIYREVYESQNKAGDEDEE